MSVQCSASRVVTFRKANGKRTDVISTKRITLHEELKGRNGLAGFFSRGISTPGLLNPYQEAHWH